MQEWENKFSAWSSGPGDTETEKIDNAVRQVRNAINKSEVLKDKELKIIVQGSYRNNVNVKKDSDVDLGILLTEVFKVDSHSREIIREVRKNYEDSTYEYSTYKNDVQQALIDHFGKPAVTRGNKAISIKENTNRIEADVVPLFEYRLYSTLINYESGVQLYTDDNNKNIINWENKIMITVLKK